MNQSWCKTTWKPSVPLSPSFWIFFCLVGLYRGLHRDRVGGFLVWSRCSSGSRGRSMAKNQGATRNISSISRVHLPHWVQLLLPYGFGAAVPPPHTYRHLTHCSSLRVQPKLREPHTCFLSKLIEPHTCFLSFYSSFPELIWIIYNIQQGEPKFYFELLFFYFVGVCFSPSSGT